MPRSDCLAVPETVAKRSRHYAHACRSSTSIRTDCESGRSRIRLSLLANRLMQLCLGALLAAVFWAASPNQAQAQVTATCPNASPGTIAVLDIAANTCSIGFSYPDPTIVIGNNIGTIPFPYTEGIIFGAEPGSGLTSVYYNAGGGDVVIPIVASNPNPKILSCDVASACSATVYFSYNGDDFSFVVSKAAGSNIIGFSSTSAVLPPNTLPTAEAGPVQTVASAAAVTLDGSASSANDVGQTLTYAWTQTGGPAVTLLNATTATPGFTAPSLAVGASSVTLTFSLVVNDSIDPSVADSVTITVTAPMDTEAPVIGAIADIAVNTDAGGNTASVVLTAPITDNSGEAIAPVFSILGSTITSPHDFPVGTTTVTVDAQDSAGNQATQRSFVVTVTDTTPPNAPVIGTMGATPDSRVGLEGTAEPGSAVAITFPDGSTQSVIADAGTGAFTVTSNTPQQSGVVTLVATDAEGNDSVPTTAGFTGDDTPPTITIGALNGPTSGTYVAAITLSEDSTDFDAADLTLTNATATLTGSGSDYTATLTPAADGTVSLSVAAGVFTDAAGNSNGASNTVSAVFAGVAPTVSISGAPEALAGGSSFTVAIAFSEVVTGFVAADISATNATVTALTGGGVSYVATVHASGVGDVRVAVPANVAFGVTGHGNLASSQVVIADVSVQQTQEHIASYMQTRANQLISNQPSLVSFLSGEPRGKFNFAVTRGAGSFDVATGARYPVWAQANGSWTNDGDSESEYVFGALGGHQTINENLLVGAMLQFDHLSEDEGVASVRGTGWMVGPYFVARSATQPLYFEGRLLYGETSNKISPFGTYEDSFDTTRLLAQLKVAGELSYGRTLLTPFMDASYSTDDQHSYVDSLGNTIPGQDIALGQIEIGMDFSTMLPVTTGDLELWGGISGIWSHIDGSGYASTVTPDYEGGRARVELGINYQDSAGHNFTVGTYYDGIGANGYESYGLSLGYEMQF